MANKIKLLCVYAISSPNNEVIIIPIITSEKARIRYIEILNKNLNIKGAEKRKEIRKINSIDPRITKLDLARNKLVLRN